MIFFKTSTSTVSDGRRICFLSSEVPEGQDPDGKEIRVPAYQGDHAAPPEVRDKQRFLSQSENQKLTRTDRCPSYQRFATTLKSPAPQSKALSGRGIRTGVRTARKTVQWTVFSGERAAAQIVLIVPSLFPGNEKSQPLYFSKAHRLSYSMNSVFSIAYT